MISLITRSTTTPCVNQMSYKYSGKYTGVIIYDQIY